MVAAHLMYAVQFSPVIHNEYGYINLTGVLVSCICNQATMGRSSCSRLADS